MRQFGWLLMGCFKFPEGLCPTLRTTAINQCQAPQELVSKCPWVRRKHWTPNCSRWTGWCLAWFPPSSVWEWVNVMHNQSNLNASLTITATDNLQDFKFFFFQNAFLALTNYMTLSGLPWICNPHPPSSPKQVKINTNYLLQPQYVNQGNRGCRDTTNKSIMNYIQ